MYSACRKQKRNFFQRDYIKQFYPTNFDSFDFLPSVGASGGTIIVWSSQLFTEEPIFQNNFAQSIEFTTLASGDKWVLTIVYEPCTDEGRDQFLQWFQNIDMLDDIDWLIVGDFNLIRYPSNRNKPGGDLNNMMAFNEAISNLRISELPLHGQKYTWSNKLENPLLQLLDWFFTSTSWAIKYPGTFVNTLSRDTSDHVPCLKHIKTNIPRAQCFRFENFWMEHHDFQQVMQQAWTVAAPQTDPAKVIVSKLKNSRKVVREWRKNLPGLANTIANSKQILMLMDTLEESRDLSLQEWNFRQIIQDHLTTLLRQ